MVAFDSSPFAFGDEDLGVGVHLRVAGVEVVFIPPQEQTPRRLPPLHRLNVPAHQVIHLQLHHLSLPKIYPLPTLFAFEGTATHTVVIRKLDVVLCTVTSLFGEFLTVDSTVIHFFIFDILLKLLSIFFLVLVAPTHSLYFLSYLISILKLFLFKLLHFQLTCVQIIIVCTPPACKLIVLLTIVQPI